MQTLATVLIFVLALPLQRIETQDADRAKVTRVETAMNHLTVIELAEPVTLAAAGSPSFKIERRENKVFIQPLEEGASTNLFLDQFWKMDLRAGTRGVNGDHAFCRRPADGELFRNSRLGGFDRGFQILTLVCGGDASCCKTDPKPWREVWRDASGGLHYRRIAKR